jgi:plasmid replication initiation protein
MGEVIVCKSNALIQAGYKLSLNEQRIILSCIGQVNSKEEITDEVVYRVAVKDIAKAINASPASLYKDVKEAAFRLLDRNVKITHTPEGVQLKGYVLATRWVQTVTYAESEGTVGIRFSKDILPYLSELKAQFTQYRLSGVIGMASMYGVRVYELIVQYRKVGKRTIGIDDLRDQLHIDPKSYERPNDLKRYVIEPALRDINDTSDMWVKCEYQKTGRRTTHLLLTFGAKKPEEITEELINAEAQPGEYRQDVIKRLKKKYRLS